MSCILLTGNFSFAKIYSMLSLEVWIAVADEKGL